MNRQKKEQLAMQHFGVFKNGKYLRGHSYATGLGTKYDWSTDLSCARKMYQYQALSLSIATKGRIVDFNKEV